MNLGAHCSGDMQRCRKNTADTDKTQFYRLETLILPNSFWESDFILIQIDASLGKVRNSHKKISIVTCEFKEISFLWLAT